MLLYNATATLEPTFASLSEGDSIEIVEHLAGYSPAVSGCPVGKAEVVISFPAESLGQATSTAMALLAPFEPIGLEVVPTDLWDQRADAVEVPELVSVAQAADKLDVSRQAILARIESGSLAGQRVGNSWVIPAANVIPAKRGLRAVE